MTPPGYVDNNVPVTVTVNNDGTIVVGQVELSEYVAINVNLRFEFFVRKVDESGVEISGAWFELREIDGPMTHVSSGGEVWFRNVIPGVYELVEDSPPLGYIPIQDRYIVVVQVDGTVTINGAPGEGYLIINIRQS